MLESRAARFRRACRVLAAAGFVPSGLLACGEPAKLGTVVQAQRPALVVYVDQPRQRISGFGASSAWTAQELSDSLADQFFSVSSGIGLSLLRVRIAPTGETWEGATARMAQQRGAVVWASPWSPPAAWKEGQGDDVDDWNPETEPDGGGGRLMTARYQDWANRLADSVQGRAEEGVNLFAISAQNEPDYVATWETCEWEPAELVTFIRDFFAPALSSRGLDTRIVAPEAANWNSIEPYANPLLSDASVRAVVDIVAVHSYAGEAFAYQAPAAQGKELWMTEVSDDGDGQAPDTGMGSALRVARMIHDHLTIAEVSAWHYWWLIPSNDGAGNQGLASAGALTRRAYALGNFSKFVRPGSVRVETSADSAGASVHVTAFRSEDSARVVIVAINAGNSEQNQTFEVAGAELASVTPWVTSASQALVAQAPLPAGNTFSYALAAQSITSFVAEVTGAASTSASSSGTSGGMGGNPGSGTGGASSTSGGGGPVGHYEGTEEGGCACAVAGRSTGSGLAWLALPWALLVVARVRRRLGT